MSTRVVNCDELTRSLSASVGREKARAALDDAAQHLGLSVSTLTQDQTLALLAHIAEDEGLLALAARFTRSRLMAQWATERLHEPSNRQFAPTVSPTGTD